MPGMTRLAPRPSPRSALRRHRLTIALSTLAQLGYAHGFFGNLYEAVVRIPHRLSGGHDPEGTDQRMQSLFSRGSPARYYLPGVPLTVASTLGALLAGWDTRRDRLPLGAAAAFAMSAGALTGYIVRALNLKLFVASHPLTPAERDRLLRTWYRLNIIRTVALGAAWLALERVRSGHAR